MGFIADIDTTIPDGNIHYVNEIDDLQRSFRADVKASFPNINAEVSANPSELNFNYGATAGTVVASKAVIVDAMLDVSGFRDITATGTIQAGTFTDSIASMNAGSMTGLVNITFSGNLGNGTIQIAGGAITGATTLTASGVITGGSFTDGTATLNAGTLTGVTISGNGILADGVTATTQAAADNTTKVATTAFTQAAIAAATASMGGTVKQIKFAAASSSDALTSSYATRVTVNLTDVEATNDVIVFLFGSLKFAAGTNLVANVQITDSSNVSILDGADTINIDNADQDSEICVNAVGQDTSPSSGSVSYRARAKESGSGSITWEHCALVAIEFTP